MNRVRHIVLGMAAAIVTIAYAGGSIVSGEVPEKYAPPKESALPPSDMKIDMSSVALVVTDPQIDFLGEAGVTWMLVGESVTELDTVANIGRLFAAAKKITRRE